MEQFKLFMANALKMDSKTKSDKEKLSEMDGEGKGTRQKNMHVDRSHERRETDMSGHKKKTHAVGPLYRVPTAPNDMDVYYFGGSEFGDDMYMGPERPKTRLTKKERMAKMTVKPHRGDMVSDERDSRKPPALDLKTFAKLLTENNVSLPSVSAPLTVSDLEAGNMEKAPGRDDVSVDSQYTGHVFTSQSDDLSGLGDAPSSSCVSAIE